jgi:hypothetical protein
VERSRSMVHLTVSGAGKQATSRTTVGKPEQRHKVQSQRSQELLQEDKAVVTPAGRLGSNLQFWTNDLKASRFVLSTIEFGYSIPFVELPSRCNERNNRSSLNNPEFVREEINGLLSRQCIREVFEVPFCCNPLTVAQGKKLRLVLDLRHVNRYVQYQTCKYEDWTVFAQMLTKDDFVIDYDQTSGYHHIGILQEHQQFLGFKFEWPHGLIRYFVFTQLPFGLSSASYVFTKLNRPFIKKWRSQGIPCCIYLDDGVAVAQGLDNAKAMSQLVKQDLLNAGFLINDEKSHWTPSKKFAWLGFEVDTHSMQISIAQKKVDKILSHTQVLHQLVINGKYVEVRSVASWVGMIVSARRACGDSVLLFTRYAQGLVAKHIQTFNGRSISQVDRHRDKGESVKEHRDKGESGNEHRDKGESGNEHRDKGVMLVGVNSYTHRDKSEIVNTCCDKSVMLLDSDSRAEISDKAVVTMFRGIKFGQHSNMWNDKIRLTEKVVSELQFWLQNISIQNGRDIAFIREEDEEHLIVCSTDASDVGYGGLLHNLEGCVHYGHWDVTESGKSSTWRELEAARRVFDVFNTKLKGRKFIWRSDSQNAVKIICTGSMVEELQDVAVLLYGWQLRNDASVIPRWISRLMNREADKLSRMSDYDDWSIDDCHFQELRSRWGEFQVDRFANIHNRKVLRFNSKIWYLQSEAVDAFTQDWAVNVVTGEKINNWWCPPVSDVLKVLNKIKVERAKGVLVVPFWTSAFFWPSILMLISITGRGRQQLKFHRFNTAFQIGSQMPDHTFNSFPNFDCLAIRFTGCE